ncbi:MAG: 16S rRNA (cytidine(1402)-2'-O)-methyltransferase [Nitrospinota bacterium]
MSDSDQPILYIVATPIGNLDDVTYRAIKILKEVDFIIAEDKRRSSILFRHYEIKPNHLISYHAKNIEWMTTKVIDRLLISKSAALISSAGTPTISDPGVILVKEAIKHQIRISPIAGPSALIAAISASGLPSHKFIFEGFLPRKKGRTTIIQSWEFEKRTVLFYEAPTRIIKTLTDIKNLIGVRKVMLAREISKIYEEFIGGDLDSIIIKLEERKELRGEFTVLIAPHNFEA